MANVIETKTFVDGARELVAEVLDSGHVRFTSLRGASVSARVLRQLADEAELAMKQRATDVT